MVFDIEPILPFSLVGVAIRSGAPLPHHEWFEFLTTQLRWLGPVPLINIDSSGHLKR